MDGIEVLDNRVTVLERDHKNINRKLDNHIVSSERDKEKSYDKMQEILICQSELKQSLKVYGSILIAVTSGIQLVIQIFFK